MMMVRQQATKQPASANLDPQNAVSTVPLNHLHTQPAVSPLAFPDLTSQNAPVHDNVHAPSPPSLVQIKELGPELGSEDGPPTPVPIPMPPALGLNKRPSKAAKQEKSALVADINSSTSASESAAVPIPDPKIERATPRPSGHPPSTSDSTPQAASAKVLAGAEGNEPSVVRTSQNPSAPTVGANGEIGRPVRKKNSERHAPPV